MQMASNKEKAVVIRGKNGWGNLIGMPGQQERFLILRRPTFSVGHGLNCDLWIKNPSASKIICTLKHTKSKDGEAVTLLQIIGKKGAVRVNGTLYSKGSTVPLAGGEELIFSSQRKFVYIFQLIANTGESTTTRMPPPVNILEAHDGSANGLHDDNSAVHITKAMSIGPTPPRNADVVPSSCKLSDTEMEDASASACNNDDASAVVGNDITPSANVPSENLNSGENLTPAFHIPAGPPASEFIDVHKFTSPMGHLPISESSIRQKYKVRLQQGIIDWKDLNASFESFPYYLRHVLIAASYMNLRCKNSSKLTSMLAALCPRILLSGPRGSEIYQETLTKALAKYILARLLIVDTLLLPGAQTKPEASAAMSKTYVFRNGDIVILVGSLPMRLPPTHIPVRGPTYGSRGKVVLAFEGIKIGVRFDNVIPGGNDLGGACEDGHGFFCTADSLRLERRSGNDVVGFLIDELFEVASLESKSSPLFLFMKDIEKSVINNPAAYAVFKMRLEALPENVVVIAPHTQADAQYVNNNGIDDKRNEDIKAMEHLSCLFPNKVTIHIPKDEVILVDWKQKLDRDAGTMKARSNIRSIHSVLNRTGFSCPDLYTLCIKDQTLSNENVEKVAAWAISHHHMHRHEVEFNRGKLVISNESISYGLRLLKGLQNENSGFIKSIKKKLLEEVIPSGDIGVSFEHIGALENVKETLKELVMLPLQRPEFFHKGQLRKPCEGILLFGPPGTGKTMLAKAFATESGANFINISTSTIMSKWFGEAEKYAKAVFTLASKIAPSVIFVDEVDRMLGRRESTGEYGAMRKIKNEFMLNWDGLCTKDKERILVLAATNRPFDLDEAVIRRLPRRLMVGLPDAGNRVKILKVILGEEELGRDVNLEAVAKMTEGYSGSDLKNLCVAAAHYPVREILERERRERSSAPAEKRALHDNSNIRLVCMDDFKRAHHQVHASVASESGNMRELVQWNELYAGGGSTKMESLSYFL